MLALNSTEAERARGCVFAENFESPTHVAKNRGTVTGTVPINFGATFNGAVGGISYPCGSLLNKPVLTFIIGFYPTVAANSGVSLCWLDTTAGATEYALTHEANNTIYFYAGGVVRMAIALAGYQDYWYQNKWNLMVVTAISGTNVWFLNGVQVGNSANAWTPVDPSTMLIGSLVGGGAVFPGKLTTAKIFTGRVAADLLTLAEARDYYNS